MRLLRTAFVPESGWDPPIDPTLDGPRTLVIAFGARTIDLAGALATLRHALPTATVFGCSTAGEIHDSNVLDDSICAAIVAFDHTTLRSARAAIAPAGDSRAAGRALGAALAHDDLRAILVLSDGLAVNGSALAAGIGERIAPRVVVTGGLAGDGERFGSTWVIDGDRAVESTISAVGLYGDHVQVGHGSQGGWDVFGHERVVTRADGNMLYELDGKPALALYKEYLGERANGLPASALRFPLSVRAPGDNARRVVRTVLAIDEARSAIRLAGDVPQGSYAQLMMANVDRLVSGAADAAMSARLAGPGPLLSIAISCIGRRLVLGGRIEEETEAALEVLPRGTQQVGFYAYGELSPSLDGACDLHNQTMTLTTIREVG
jgi:hypothetical protein